jgi:hypothetical protein
MEVQNLIIDFQSCTDFIGYGDHFRRKLVTEKVN